MYDNAMITFNNYRLLPGDVLVVKQKTFTILDHYLVYMGYGRFVAFMRAGIRSININELQNFSGDYYPVRLRKFGGTELERKQALLRAENCLLPEYSLLFSNCEHFADFVQNGKRRSLQSFKAGVALIGAGTLMSSESKSETVQFIGGLSILAGIFTLINEGLGGSNTHDLATN